MWHLPYDETYMFVITNLTLQLYGSLWGKKGCVCVCGGGGGRNWNVRDIVKRVWCAGILCAGWSLEAYCVQNNRPLLAKYPVCIQAVHDQFFDNSYFKSKMLKGSPHQGASNMITLLSVLQFPAISWDSHVQIATPLYSSFLLKQIPLFLC